MSDKVLDRRGRYRSQTVAFRASPQEAEAINAAVALSGLTKREFIIRRLHQQDILVQGNPRVYKALRNHLQAVLCQLQRIEAGQNIDPDLIDLIHLINNTLDGLKQEGLHQK